MYVCSCRAVNDRTVRAVVAGGALTVEDVMARCDAGTVCGGCIPLLEELVAQAVIVRDATADHHAA